MGEPVTFITTTSDALLDYVSRQIVAIADLQESEAKPDSVQKLANHLTWLRFWQFATTAGAEFGWTIEQCCRFQAYDVYKLESEIETRMTQGNLILKATTFPSWLMEINYSELTHMGTYPFYEVKTVFEITPNALHLYFNKCLEAAKLPLISMDALRNQAAIPLPGKSTSGNN